MPASSSLLYVSAFLLASAGLNAAPLEKSDIPPAYDGPVDFVRDIQPIFSNNCYSCHGPEKQQNELRLDVKAVALRGGMSGEAISPGDSAGSLLIQYVSGIPEDMRMPQKGEPLSAREIGLLRAWIDQGAHWPDGLDPEGYVEPPEHWAFRPLERPPLPPTKRSDWGRNEIDRFILARLEEENLSPSEEAGKRDLIRRLYFTIVGLPPAPKEIAEFLDDTGDLAYERLVDRLLASPHYGERWARHWLDVVRFAESNGFETNTERPNAWPYRDYVIAAFNDDKPYNRFVLEQLAGDLFGADAATGFLVGGPYDTVKSPDINLTLQQRMDELHDMINTTSTAFLGLTVGCARCHNHKFDPILQKDYYAMQAIFAGVRHGARQLRPPDYEERMDEAEVEKEKLARIEAELLAFVPLADPAAFDSKKRKAPSAKLNEETFEPVAAKSLRFTILETIDGTEPCIDELEIYSAGNDSRNIALASAGAAASASGTYPNSPSHKLTHINDGRVGNSYSWLSSQRGAGWVQIDFPEEVRLDRVVWGRDREEMFKDRVPSAYTIEVSSEPGVWRTVAGRPPLRSAVNPRQNVDRFAEVEAKFLRFTILETTGGEPCLDELEVYTAGAQPRNIALAAEVLASGTYPNFEIHKLEHVNDGRYGNGRSWISNEKGQGWVQFEFPAPVRINRVVWGRDREEKYGDRLATKYKIETALMPGDWKLAASSGDREPYSAGAKPKRAYSAAGLGAREVKRLEELLERKAAHEKRIAELTEFPMVYAGTFEQPGPTHLLHRGEAMQKREQVSPGAVHGIGAPLELAADTPEQDRRLALARWIIDPQNPLPARVMVNRLWQYNFGRGIVDTPSDFGNMGIPPTHPKLLDWLAAEFIESGWSIKHIQKLILMSATFRQSSEPQPGALRKDADTQLYWRYPPRRLEAEPLRDTILAVSGNLDLRMGGPGFDLFQPNSNYVKVYKPKKEFGPAEWRRMIYQAKPRMRLDDTFGAFDCPDGGQPMPKRNVSTTPLQALNLLNSPFIMQQADIFADRLRNEAGPRPGQRIDRAFLLAFGRPPSPVERRAATELIQGESLEIFCRALFNANEFIYVF